MFLTLPEPAEKKQGAEAEAEPLCVHCSPLWSYIYLYLVDIIVAYILNVKGS